MRGEALVCRESSRHNISHDQSAPALKPARTALFQRGHARGHGRQGPAAADARCRVRAGARGSALGHHPQESRSEADRRCCVADKFDIAALGEAAVASGNIAIPLVKALTAAVKKRDANAAGYVHWGATSQDIIDTALVLDLRAAIDVAAERSQPRHRALSRKSQLKHRKTPTRGAHMAAAGAADAVRAESGRLCGGAWRARAGGCNDCATKHWCCNSAARRERWPRSASAASRSSEELAHELEAPAARKRPGTAIATGSARSPAPSPFSPAPAERSRAMSRC